MLMLLLARVRCLCTPAQIILPNSVLRPVFHTWMSSKARTCHSLPACDERSGHRACARLRIVQRSGTRAEVATPCHRPTGCHHHPYSCSPATALPRTQRRRGRSARTWTPAAAQPPSPAAHPRLPRPACSVAATWSDAPSPPPRTLARERRSKREREREREREPNRPWVPSTQ